MHRKPCRHDESRAWMFFAVLIVALPKIGNAQHLVD
jgi:hypothetical protein